MTFVLYNGKEAWTSAKSVSELFVDFDEYVEKSLKTSFLVNLSKEEMATLQTQGAAAAPQIIMKNRAKGNFTPILDTLWPLLKKHQQDDEQNLDYMATLDAHGDDAFIKKLSKFDPKTANHYKTMFEAAIRKAEKRAEKRAEKKALKLGIIRRQSNEGIHQEGRASKASSEGEQRRRSSRARSK